MGAITYFGEKRFKLFYTLLLLVGGIFVFLGILEYQKTPDVPNYWHEAQGEVLFTEQLSSSSFRPTVRFILQNETGVRAPTQNTFRSGFEEGVRIPIYYNPMDPKEVIAERGGLTGYGLYLFIGIMLSGLGFRLFVGTLMRNFSIAFIKENGKQVYPQEVSVGESRARIIFLKREIYFLRCRWKNTINETSYTFVGAPLPAPPELSEGGYVEGKKVLVYFLEASPDKYYIEW